MITIAIPRALRTLAGRFGNPTAMLADANAASADACRALLMGETRSGKDPYGVPWRPRVFERLYSHPTLRRTGAMIANVSAQASPRHWSLKYGHKRAIWHHYGTGVHGQSRTPITPKRAKLLRFTIGGQTFHAKSVQGVHRRLLVPTNRWPGQWKQAMKREYMAAARRRFTGRG